MNSDYKSKYIKYKNKYLALKQDIYISKQSVNTLNNNNKYLKLKNKLTGGANCPQVGFHQHIGECVHDSFLMIILYSDNFSEHIQALFDSPNFNIEHCMSADRDPSNKLFLPIQIEILSPEFKRHSLEYIKNIFERYTNEKLTFADDEALLSLSSQRLGFRPVYAPPSIKPESLPRLHRRDSINESLACIYSSTYITNINMVEHGKTEYSHNKHNSNYLNTLTNIGLINYYLVNYRPANIFTSSTTSANKKFLSVVPFGLFEMFNINTDDLDDLDVLLEQINGKLDYLHSLINSDQLLGINLNLGINDEPELSGHEVAFIKCNGSEKFYDNNGVHEVDSYEPFDETEPPNTTELVKYPESYMKKEANLTVNFNWKQYLLDIIDEYRDKLRRIRGNDIMEELNKMALLFSKFFTRDDSLKKYGGNDLYGSEYLENYFIKYLYLIFVNDVSSPDTMEEEYIVANAKNILEASVYTNDRAYDLISKALHIFPDQFENTFISLIQNRNYKLINKILNDNEFPLNVKLQHIISIISNILENPYDEINEEIIKILIAFLKQRPSDPRFAMIIRQIFDTIKSKSSSTSYAKLF